MGEFFKWNNTYGEISFEAAKGKKKIGSTLKGIGPTYMDKTGRNGLRVGDIQLENFPELYNTLVTKHMQLLKGYPDFEYNIEELEKAWFSAIDYLRTLDIIDSEPFVHNAIREGRTILAEGAQGTLLDIDFGTYPFVTSSNTTCAGACTGLGVAPNRIKNVYGIFKAYITRVGSGPFPTELFNSTGELIQAQGHEFGATTGRPRRCGWLDLPALKYAIDINGVTELMMMKSDVLSGVGNIQVCTVRSSLGGHCRVRRCLGWSLGFLRRYSPSCVGSANGPLQLLGTPVVAS